MLIFEGLLVESMSHRQLLSPFQLSIRWQRKLILPVGEQVANSASITPSPTPSGTIANCGLYYLVAEGDDCSLVSEKYGLTFSEFIGAFTLIAKNLC